VRWKCIRCQGLLWLETFGLAVVSEINVRVYEIRGQVTS
jgi:hypothetical protein